jgi:hypothetical protein
VNALSVHRNWIGLTLMATLGLGLILAPPGFAARRVVLFEECTSSTCPPCATANPVIHQFLEDYSVAQVVAVKWHVWWPAPGNDPSYLHNTTAVRDRITDYYHINAAPDCTVDGVNGPTPGDYGGMQTWVENRLAIPAPLSITATGVLNGPQTGFDVSISVNVETAQPAGNYALYVALIEEHIQYTGTNGETDHYQVFRHANAAPDIGEPIDLTTTGIQNFNRTILRDIEIPAQLAAVVWVQNNTTKEVLNAGTTWPAPAHFIRVAGGTPGVVNDPNTVALLDRDIVNLGTQNDVYDISVSGMVGNLPDGWTFEYTTSQGTFTGPSTLPLNAGQGETIQVEIDSHGIPGGGLLEMMITSQGDPGVSKTLRFSKISNPDVIVYDDDGSQNYENLLIAGLNAEGVGWGLWEDAWGKLSGAQLSTAPVVFWSTGLSYPTFDATDRTAITAFLAGGGKGFFNGQEIGWELNTSNSGNYNPTWYQANMHATYNNDAAGWALTGVAGDVIGNGLTYFLNSGNQPYPDGAQPIAPAVGSVTYNTNPSLYKGVIRWDSGGSSKVVYMAHGIEGIVSEPTRLTLIERIINWFGVTTGVPNSEAPPVASLSANYPNPFTPNTHIPFSLRQEGQVRLTIYDVAGRLVRELVRGDRPAGSQVAVWDGRDATGKALGSGIYYYRIEAPDFEATRSMVLVK